MIDHVLGRPSTRFRKYQVFAVVFVWSLYLHKSDRHGPKPLRRLSEYLSNRLTVWQTVVLMSLYLYVTRNFARVIGLESPEPLANLYTRDYFRATWVTTALDAGFWSAMHLRPTWLKNMASMVFSVYYLICAEQADEMVRKVRGGLTLQHLRVSWDKPKTPYLSFFTSLLRPKLTNYPPRRLRIPRPQSSAYKEPIDAWLYFDGPVKSLKEHDKVVLDIPGGGFVAMDPRCHEDKLLAWAGRTGLPVVALDYKKAPEHPYPYALNECYDAYWSIVASFGQCIGLSGETRLKIIVSGDSAGGNLAVGLVLMLLQDSPHASYFPDDRRTHLKMPLPEALIIVYPALDVNITSWMTDEQMALIKNPERRRVNKSVLRHKSDNYRKLTPNTPYGSDGEAEEPSKAIPDPDKSNKRNRPREKGLTASPESLSGGEDTKTLHDQDRAASKTAIETSKPLRTRLAMSSMISYFNDRVITPEMLRAMVILYIGPYNRPDFATDFLLSPLLAPESLLARFPKVYMLTGERDPLVDDTVIFAGRLRQAHLHRFRERKELGLIRENENFNESDHVEVTLIPGISHGFLQFVSVFPQGWKYIFQCSRWMRQVFAEADKREAENEQDMRESDYFSYHRGERCHHRAESSDNEDRPLEMSALNMTSISSGSKKASKRRSSHSDRKSESGRGRIKKTLHSGRKSPVTTRKNLSLSRLPSHEDLMKRRMHGLTGNLMGEQVNLDTP